MPPARRRRGRLSPIPRVPGRARTVGPRAWSPDQRPREAAAVKDASRQAPGLQKSPLIAVEVLEYSHHAVALLFWIPHEDNALRLVSMIVAPKVVGVERQKNPAAGLVSYSRGLLWPDKECQGFVVVAHHERRQPD